MTEMKIISADSGLAKTKHTDDLPPHHEAWQDGWEDGQED